MASSEEDRARALLLDRQRRIAESAHAALDLPTSVTNPQDIRSAFLELTKVFHPARFGRMSNEVQRLSNEVFLSLKAAHEALAKPKSARQMTTSNIPVVRPPTRPFGVPVAQRPAAGSGPTPTNPPASHPPTNRPPATAPRPPPSGSTSPARPAGSTGVKFGTPAASPAPNPTPTSNRATGSASMPTLDRELAPILEMIAAGQWEQAQRAIDKLSAAHPQSKRYQAMAMYCRGRRAQLEQNLGDARVELSQALLLDPDLELAKTALNELFGRRK